MSVCVSVLRTRRALCTEISSPSSSPEGIPRHTNHPTPTSRCCEYRFVLQHQHKHTRVDVSCRRRRAKLTPYRYLSRSLRRRLPVHVPFRVHFVCRVCVCGRHGQRNTAADVQHTAADGRRLFRGRRRGRPEHGGIDTRWYVQLWYGANPEPAMVGWSI